MICAKCVFPRSYPKDLRFIIRFAGHDFYGCPNCRAIVFVPVPVKLENKRIVIPDDIFNTSLFGTLFDGL